MRILIIIFLLFPCFLFAQQDHSHSHAKAHDHEHLNHLQQPTKIIVEPFEGAAPYTHLEFNDSESKFQFAIVADRTGSNRPGIFMDAVNKVNLLQPEFVMSVGDLIEGYTEDVDELNRQWDEFSRFVKALEMPFFYVPGNHDITNKVMEDLWKKRFGQTFYHFIYKEVLFLALNSEDQRKGSNRGTISDKQFDYIKSTLEENADVKWTFIFMHQPLWHQKETNRWKEVEILLKGRQHTVFAGHEHAYVKEDRNNGKYFTLATTGGGSSIRGHKFGEFDHFLWVSMGEDGPVMANLMLEGIWDENVVTAEHKHWLKEMGAKNPFQIQPVMKQNEMFYIGGGHIKITNDRNEVMQVRFEESNSKDLTGTVEEKEFVVNPNSVKEIKYSLRSRNNSCEEAMKLNAYVHYQSSDSLLNLEIPYSFLLKPVEKRYLRKSESKIQVDGHESDWLDFPFSFKEADDFKASFNLLYDDEYLYMAMKVEDGSIKSLGKGESWKQDNAGFGFSADPMQHSVMMTGKGYYRNMFYQLISPENENVGSVYYREMPEGGLIKCLEKEYGYFAEMAIPISFIESRQGKEWKTIRVVAAVDDFDGDAYTRHWWLPNWRDASSNYIGSGLFYRVP